MSVRRPALVFRHIDLRRTPGIPAGFQIDRLCEGINVAYGPNASGKTTTALALQMLLWNNLDGAWRRAAVAGRAELEGEQWYIEIDTGTARYQRDGEDGARLPIDEADGGSRYILTLHDLLQADNRNFADVILKESAGGYDLDAARQSLGYKEPTGRAIKLTSDVRKARATVQQAEREQADLAREEQSLARLRAELETARSADEQATVLDRAIRGKETHRELQIARERLAEFPDRIADVTGKELEQLQGLRERRDELERRKRETQQRIQDAQQRKRETNLEHIDLPGDFLPMLRSQAQQLREVESRIAEAERELAEQSAQRARAAHNLGDAITEEQLAELEAGKLGEVARLGRALEEARASFKAADDLRQWVGNPEPHDDIERLQRGLTHLNAWLRAGRSTAVESAPDRSSTVAWVSAALIGLASLVAAVAGHPALILLIVLAVVPILLARRPASEPTSTAVDEAGYAQRQYERLGLDGPASWDVDQVEALVERLTGELHRQQLAQARAQRWSHVEKEWAAARENLDTCEAEWHAALGESDLDHLEPEQLDLLAERLGQWREADSRVHAAEAKLQTEQQRHRELLEMINERLATFGYQAAGDHAGVQGQIDDLDQRQRQLESAIETIEREQRQLEISIEPDLNAVERQIREIFASLGLEVVDDRTLADWVKQRDAYMAAYKAVEEAEYAVRRMRAELGENVALLERDDSHLEAELRDARERAAQADEINERIIQIQTRVEDAKQAHNLEDALVELERASDELREEREQQSRLLAGWLVVEELRERTRDRDRPAVFHQARRLFSRITQGRYELQFSDNPEPAFRATDTTTGISHGLDELSSATRVQLLMAVRLAFVEEMERGPKLPLILDETLGNADEHRAEAIIRAACEICRDGRQIFYFTAQRDEVAKWRRLLADHADVPHQIIDLAEARKLPELDPSVLIEIESPRVTVPAPEGRSHQAYRDMIHVPEIDPWADIGSIHLWYVIHDPEVLHALLTYGVPTWGQLRNMIQLGGADLAPDDVYAVAEARARALEAAIDAWRVGKNRPVNRSVVYDSGIFSDRMVGRVAEQVDVQGGAPGALIQALKDGEVPHLRNDDRVAFEEYLLDHGFLTEDDPLSESDIRSRAVATASDALSAGLISAEDIDFLLRCLGIDDDVT